MSEAELHILRGRLDGGIRNKAARGELRRALPVGLVWGENEGEIRFHPDEAVGTITTSIAFFSRRPGLRLAIGRWEPIVCAMPGCSLIALTLRISLERERRVSYRRAITVGRVLQSGRDRVRAAYGNPLRSWLFWSG
jgi:hypothetical protein